MRFSVILATFLMISSSAFAQMEHMHMSADERLGTVAFPISCAAPARPVFTRAVAELHSFWYEHSEKSFRQVAAIDPRCGMAWWGVAMSNFHQVWPTPYTPAELARGMEAAQKASAIGAKTPRERAYIDAADVLYRDAMKVDLSIRARAYEAAMQKLTTSFPDDDEASIFYALILINHGMAMPKDKTYAYQKQAAAILNGLLERHPDHPGIAHYMIHAFDYPALAPLALNAANAYSKIAPGSPHALHMPSHIYTRLGMWDEAIESNLASAKAAHADVERNHPGATSFDELHADDYLAYAWLQRGEDARVRGLIETFRGIQSLDTENFAAFYAIAAVPARYTIERHLWAEAAALPPLATQLPWDRYAYAESLTDFARAVGAARVGNLAAARSSVDRLAQLRQKLLDAKSAYWADQVDVQRRAAAAWIARAEGKNDEAVNAMQSAADLEDAMDKSPVTPGSIVPAREMLGDLLLELHQPAAALAAYERSLKDSPNRLNALSGAARAAQFSGEKDKAREYYVRVAKLLQ